MPARATPLVNNEFYHIFNRGADKKIIYLQQRDYSRFIRTIFYYQFAGPKPKFSTFSKFNLNSFKPISKEKHLEILCYCLMPNHFHLLVRQLNENGIKKFMQQVQNSYGKYFNTKHTHTGPLFQGRFKAVRIESDEQLLHVSRYIHLNPIVSGLVKYLESAWPSSYSEYTINPIICNIKEILAFFPSNKAYAKFVSDQIEYGKNLNKIKHHILDDDIYDYTPGVEG